ncbi:MAG: hypothetical protein ACRDSP_25950 [Pseudonocardiaceae bacterium]
MTADAARPDDLMPAVPDRRPIALTQELNVMLLHEVLARTRMREDQQHASQARLASRLATARRWQRLARFAEQRAHRATTRL